MKMGAWQDCHPPCGRIEPKRGLEGRNELPRFGCSPTWSCGRLEKQQLGGCTPSPPGRLGAEENLENELGQLCVNCSRASAGYFSAAASHRCLVESWLVDPEATHSVGPRDNFPQHNSVYLYSRPVLVLQHWNKHA
ncbi:hypothetical protein EYF80_042273 [Liparis tanakae]|uniref:Uncharacterized protein n=1 Tax=Liparis tanakae TaxID=230148 RepID=A0A4Z2G4Q4_9TELE|nr:hypothetical protein EYF80_042273 [Liparis tanakae]